MGLGAPLKKKKKKKVSPLARTILSLRALSEGARQRLWVDGVPPSRRAAVSRRISLVTVVAVQNEADRELDRENG